MLKYKPRNAARVPDLATYYACVRAIDAVLEENPNARLLVQDYVARQVRFDLGFEHSAYAQPVASLVADLPPCALLNALYSQRVLRHHVSDAMSMIRNNRQGENSD